MLIGREKEQYILRQALQADRSRFGKHLITLLRFNILGWQKATTGPS